MNSPKFAQTFVVEDLKARLELHLKAVMPELLLGKSLLAISGGLDSTVLCHVLQEIGLSFELAHCNFQLRGEESEMDALFVQERAKKMRLTLHQKNFDLSTAALKSETPHSNQSVQMRAREQRYRWFDQLMKEQELNFLITAHHKEDNLETFLINLSRASGLKGLLGIPEKSRQIRRPLLNFSKTELLHYAQNKGITWREDSSNKDTKYLRNKVRHEVVPALLKGLPELETSFPRSLAFLKADHQLLQDGIDRVHRDVRRPCAAPTEGFLYAIDKMEKVERLEAYLPHFFGPYGFKEFDKIKALMSAQSGKYLSSSSHRLLKNRGELILQKITPGQNEDDKLYQVEEATAELSLTGGQLLFKPVDLDKRQKQKASKDRNRALLSVAELNFPLFVRKWQKGDYFYPEGMQGKKKLSKFFKDEKLSLSDKENIWLLCSGQEVAWIIGLRRDRRFILDEKETEGIDIKFIPQHD